MPGLSSGFLSWWQSVIEPLPQIDEELDQARMVRLLNPKNGFEPVHRPFGNHTFL